MADLKELLLHYRRGRAGFDSLALEAAHLFASGELLPPYDADGASLGTVAERLAQLDAARLEEALAGKLGTVLLSREEHRQLLEDIAAFLRAWLPGELDSE